MSFSKPDSTDLRLPQVPSNTVAFPRCSLKSQSVDVIKSIREVESPSSCLSIASSKAPHDFKIDDLRSNMTGFYLPLYRAILQQCGARLCPRQITPVTLEKDARETKKCIGCPTACQPLRQKVLL